MSNEPASPRRNVNTTQSVLWLIIALVAGMIIGLTFDSFRANRYQLQLQAGGYVRLDTRTGQLTLHYTEPDMKWVHVVDITKAGPMNMATLEQQIDSAAAQAKAR